MSTKCGDPIDIELRFPVFLVNTIFECGWLFFAFRSFLPAQRFIRAVVSEY